LPEWSADNPVILVGHSAGAHTCLALQRLLGDDHFGIGSTADWVEAVICISGVPNGSTLTYRFGCDPVTGVLTDDPERLIRATVDIASRVPKLPIAEIEPWLEQWTDRDAFVRGKDNLACDLTLSGCHAANAAFSTNPNSYYLSLVTSMPAEQPKTARYSTSAVVWRNQFLAGGVGALSGRHRRLRTRSSSAGELGDDTRASD